MPPRSVKVNGQTRQLEGGRAPAVAQGVHGRRALLDGVHVDDQFVRLGCEGRDGGFAQLVDVDSPGRVNGTDHGDAQGSVLLRVRVVMAVRVPRWARAVSTTADVARRLMSRAADRPDAGRSGDTGGVYVLVLAWLILGVPLGSLVGLALKRRLTTQHARLMPYVPAQRHSR